MSDKLKSLVESIKGLTVMELADLVKALETELGVSAAAMAMPVAAAGAAAPAAAVEEATSFNVVLTEGGANKIAVIKVVREVLGLGLADAKGFVEGAPKPIKEGVDKAAAAELKTKFEAAGAKVEIKAA